MTDRASLLADFIAGADSAAAVELVRGALRRWARSDGAIPLQRFAGLHTPQEFRRDERDRWLRAAFGHAGSIAALATAVRAFERRTWRAWSNHSIAPAHADELNAALFYARYASLEALPESAKQLRRIVDRDTESANHVPPIAA